MKEFLSTKLGKVCAAIVLLLFVFWLVLQFKPQAAWPLLEPVLLAVVLTAIALAAIDLGFRRLQRRRQASFDARLAAREGIEDRRREWAEWTTELRRQGIDRYQLPMYLLVGEPQSGKSILLRNSDLHFPFGQNRLSGVGGTRGCDWWFTDQAVILDLAGRLFTHEGGASDEAEWAAFLELLAEYRPQCPANGVILVLPCDGLAGESEPAVAKKAAKMQNALLTLTNKLQARLPVYVVLTKADKVFGFAECVHRLDAPKRQEMFGWSRPLEKLEAPFDVEEAHAGFSGMVERGRLLRSQMLATARPEALTEVDRFYAFPEELAALWPMLQLYLQRVFTESQLIDQLFFRGIYLTSGLQSGAPIAKVCAELLGSSGEADRRNLEGLFTKQRAYFIKELIRERVFTEQGLVRPTRRRVVRARRNAYAAYGIAGVIALGSLLLSAWDLSRTWDKEDVESYRVADDRARIAVQNRGDLQAVAAGIVAVSDAVKEARSAAPDYPTYLSEMVNKLLLPLLGSKAASAYVDGPDPTSNAEFKERIALARGLITGIQLSDPALRGILDRIEFTPEVHDGLQRALASGHGFDRFVVPSADQKRIVDCAEQLWKGALDAGSGWAPPGQLGYVLARKELVPQGTIRSLEQGCTDAHRFAHAVYLLVESQDKWNKDPLRVSRAEVEKGLADLKADHERFVEAVHGDQSAWVPADQALREIQWKNDSLEVAKELRVLLDDEAGRVCAPSFLSEAKAASQPSDLLRDLASPPAAGSVAYKVFTEKCRCAEGLYVTAFPTVEKLREKLTLPGGSDASDLEISSHLGGLLQALSSLPFDAWRDRARALIDEHVELLESKLGKTIPEAASNFLAFSSISDGTNQNYIDALRKAAREIAEGRESSARVLSCNLVKAGRTARGSPSGPGHYMDHLFRAFCEIALREKIRPDFIGEFRTMLGKSGAYSGVIDSLWGAGEGDAKLSFFDRGAALDNLLGAYCVELAEGKDAPVDSSPAWRFDQFRSRASDADAAAWNALGFLREVQTYVLKGGDGKTAQSAKAGITIGGDKDSPFFQKSGNFYVMPGSKGPQSFAYELIERAGLKKPVVQDWSFAFKDWRMRWTQNNDKFGDYTPGDYRLMSSGPFAPMLLAWSGSQSGGDWIVPFEAKLVAPKAESQVLTGNLILHFDRPLPPRPKPPFD